LVDKASPKVKKELKEWTANLPESVNLAEEGKVKPWDKRYIKTQFKKKYLELDEQKIAEYFPMEHTIKQLLSIYERFLSIKFKEISATGFWHEDVKLIEAHEVHSNKLLGYILLDLYPRDNKFSHAAHTTIISCVSQNGQSSPSVGIVIANFPKPTSSKPSLLKFKDVQTFFHEFGHAIHTMLGCTEFYSFSGTNVKKDFVEMPSQMLEDWMNDKEILKMVSKHYKNNEPLPENLIDKLTKLEKFDSGDFILQQVYYSLLSLDYYAQGKNKDTQEISKKLYKKVLNYMLWSDENHFQASFGHITDYGPSYYGYLWSKVFAKDLFYEIKKYGLLNPEIGKKYIKEVIGKGGSKDPNELLRNFLGRKPVENAFFNDFGIS
jgi:thimet oligopeptidase